MILGFDHGEARLRIVVTLGCTSWSSSSTEMAPDGPTSARRFATHSAAPCAGHTACGSANDMLPAALHWIFGSKRERPLLLAGGSDLCSLQLRSAGMRDEGLERPELAL